MFRVVTTITFTQQPTDAHPQRNDIIIYNFVNQYEASSSWADLTDKAKITLPKNVYVRDKDNNLVSLAGTNVNLGGFNNNSPLFLKGDRVVIQAGYRYFNSVNQETLVFNTIFEGYITKVGSKKPVEIECEDNMYKLKQIIAPNKVFPAKDYTLEKIMQELIKGTGFTVNVVTNTSVGDFRTQSETVAEVLARLKKDYHFFAYFKGGELRVGSFVYIESDAIASGRKVFKFQHNIIDDDLDYNRRDDVNLSCIAYSVNKKELSTTTARGKKKTKSERLEVLVTNQGGKFVRKEKKPGEKAEYAPNTSGERRTLYFWNVQTAKELGDLAEKELAKYYYTGFKGKFTTFGIPLVRQGDNVDILDAVLPERNGRYKVKSVKYTGGVDGLRQEIELDFLIIKLDANGNGI